MIKFEHTIFALPFAFLGMLLAAEGWPRPEIIGWIVVAMVGARSAAMGFNRLVDRKIDAANPRTADRALPLGTISPKFTAVFVAASSALLMLAAWRLNPLALRLTPVVFVVIFGYSYTKRFTSFSHLVLGLALSGAPLGAWIAVRGSVALTPLVLSAAVLFWVAGFDVLYALQDLEFDRSRHLHSIPSHFGEVGALWFSGLFHLAMILLLAWLPQTYLPGLGLGYWAGVGGCALMLVYQHWVVRPGDLSRINAAFFQANGMVAIWLLLATAFDFYPS
jgi:4-hydroxybenzoate polyprenyltransferase